MKLITHALQAVFVFQTLKQVYGPWLWPLGFSNSLSEITNGIFHNVLDLPFMLYLLLFAPLQIFTLLTANKSSHTSIHSFYCVSWMLVISTKGMRLRSFTVNEKLEIVKEAEKTSNRSVAHLLLYFLFIYLFFVCWFWMCTPYSRAWGISVNTVIILKLDKVMLSTVCFQIKMG